MTDRRTQETRPFSLVGHTHPELDKNTRERVADNLAGVAEGYGTDVRTTLREQRLAEERSAAGHDLNT